MALRLNENLDDNGEMHEINVTPFIDVMLVLLIIFMVAAPLATAIGLVAAIPAVVIYNIFARMIGSYKATLGDVAAQVLLLQSRDLDLNASSVKPVHAASKLRAG